MNMTTKKETQLLFLRRFCLAVLHGYLFFPILEVFASSNELPSVQSLFYFFTFTQLLFFLVPKWYISFPVQTIAGFYVLHQYFPYEEPFSLNWVQFLLNQLQGQMTQLLNGETALFPYNWALLIVIALISVSSYLLLRKKNPFLSFVTCLGYLLILQIFTTKMVQQEAIQVLGFGLVMYGVSRISIERSRRSFALSLGMLGMSSAVLLTLSSWGMENLSTQQQWVQAQTGFYRDSLQKQGFFEWVDQYSTVGLANRSGYSENDEELGGPLQQDSTPVFKAYTDEPRYWRISTKNVYTGKGWQSSTQYTLDVPTPFSGFMTTKSTGETKEVRLELADDFPHLPYTYGTRTINFYENNSAVSLSLEHPTEKIIQKNHSGPTSTYFLSVADTTFDAAQLEQSPAISEDIRDPYLQLPYNQLPDRVRELAATITEDETTQYGKVRAIENYLKNEGGFRYSLRDASYVPEGQDYVDYFLFDSKVGYCDNFSTAMVVLARSLGIQARWAKGFSSGELVTPAEGESYYEVTNANAHSWPEIFFADQGWVPFEPTPAYAQPVTDERLAASEVEDIPNASTPQTADEAIEAPTNTNTPDEAEPTEAPDAPSESPEEKAAEPVAASTLEKENTVNDRWFYLFLPALVLIIGTAIVKRYTMVVWFIKQLLTYDWINLKQANNLVLWLFQKKRKKEQKQTLRLYFNQWIPFASDSSQDISAFIRLAEEVLYAPSTGTVTASPEQKKVIVQILAVFEDLPSVKVALKHEASSSL